MMMSGCLTEARHRQWRKLGGLETLGCVASVRQIKPRLIHRRSALASLGLYALFFFVFMLPPGRILLGSL